MDLKGNCGLSSFTFSPVLLGHQVKILTAPDIPGAIHRGNAGSEP